MQPEWLAPQWPAPACVRALSTWRVGGSSAAGYASLNLAAHVGDEPEAVAENRRRLCAAAELPAEPVWLTQVHGAEVADLDDDNHDPAPRDAAVARRAGRICAILTADCLPVLFTSESGDVVAAAHAGWRGLAAGVLEATVQALHTAPERVLAWLGPAIGPRHFEVGAEVRDELIRVDPRAAAAFQPNARGRFLADLFALARSRLTYLGISRVYGGGECTYTDADRYFSYRRDRRTGRQATLIWIDR